ncbi:MAG: response regulator, partial [bacterium]|nr:response regulator [bacterium]
KSKSEFLANMSHEIRTPLNSILGFSELLEELTAGEQQKEYLKSIRSGGETLLGLFNDILDLSKIESGKIELNNRPIDVSAICREIKTIFLDKTNWKGLDFILEIDSMPPAMLVLDEIRLRQILFNLVGNAIKFTHTGHIKLSVRLDSLHEGTVKPSPVDLTFSVEDTGIGIPGHQQETIFESFRQGDGLDTKKYGGPGLGLAITTRLVQIMGGHITLSSSEGAGSTFTVVLHNVATADTDIEHVDSRITPPGGKVVFDKALLLIADDIEDNVLLLIDILKPYNLDVIKARNGREAVELALKFRPDLIVMDMRMPEMDGYEATRIIKQNALLKETPVVALTASVLKRAEVNCKLAGCSGFLKKPVAMEDIIRELQRFLPYSIVPRVKKEKKVPPTSKSTPLVLTAKNAAALPRLVTLLEGKLSDRLKKIQNTYVLSDIETFGSDIKRLGEKNNLSAAVQWGEQVFRQAGSFNMAKLPATLATFPALVKQISGLAESVTKETNKKETNRNEVDRNEIEQIQ